MRLDLVSWIGFKDCCPNPGSSCHPQIRKSDYANGVDRLRDLVKAYKIASQLDADGVKESLYWPHLLEMLEEMIPVDDGVDRALVAVNQLDAN